MINQDKIGELSARTCTFIDKVGQVFQVPKSRYRSIVDYTDYNDNEVTYGEPIVDTTGYLPLDKLIQKFMPDMNVDEDIEYLDEDTDNEEVLDVSTGDVILDNAAIYGDILSPDTNSSEQPMDKASEQEEVSVGNNIDNNVDTLEKVDNH